METRQIKGALKAMPIKTDRRDAEGISRLLHLGWFRPVHCKSVSAQEARAVVGSRKAIRQGMIALELPIRALLRNFGLKVGAISRERVELRIRDLSVGNLILEPKRNRCSERGHACGRNSLDWSAVSANREEYRRLEISPCAALCVRRRPS